MNRCFIDFEYNGTSEAILNLVSSAFVFVSEKGKVQKKKIWLYNDEQKKKDLAGWIKSCRENTVFYCFNGVAEGSSFIALGLHPSKFKWVDLQNEWKMLINHRNEYAYGKQLIKGVEKVTSAPRKMKYQMTEEDKAAADASKADRNLAAMYYKLCGKKIDTDRKDMIRNIIIEGNPDKIVTHMDLILDYNLEDAECLVEIRDKLFDAYDRISSDVNVKIRNEEILLRGRTSADVALMTCYGYPVNVEWMKNFAGNVGEILSECAEDINRQFPDKNFFMRKNKNSGPYTMKQQPWKDWIEKESGLFDKWMKTKKGAISLKLDAFEEHFSYKHDYPEGNVAAQAMRYLKLKQSLNGFSPNKQKESIFDSLGSDGRVRSWLNPYGSQTSRFQPKATSFIPLKAAWMRAMIQPPKNHYILGVDYSSEEFLISACWSEDENMYNAYKSGDVYLYFAKLAGAVPWEGTKEEYKAERNLFKSTTLGISYLMGPDALAKKLTADTGTPHTKEQAEELIHKFNTSFPRYHQKIVQTQYDYGHYKYAKLPDGWTLFGDNPNRRSVANFPIQGRGGVILRSAIRKCIDAGLKVIIPLHDALYVEYACWDTHVPDDVIHLMREAFIECFEGRGQQMARAIRLDAFVWGEGIPEGLEEFQSNRNHPIACQKLYIDDRAINDYERFKKYFLKTE